MRGRLCTERLDHFVEALATTHLPLSVLLKSCAIAVSFRHFMPFGSFFDSLETHQF
jgi:hypothetical protein